MHVTFLTFIVEFLNVDLFHHIRWQTGWDGLIQYNIIKLLT